MMEAISVSPQDKDLLAAHRWQVDVRKDGRAYVSRSEWQGKVSRKIYLHRVIAGATRGQHVDHINGNTLDNRRENLRVCSPSENQANRGQTRSNTSGAKGVHLVQGSGRWRAQITVAGKKINLGRFDTIEEASSAYDAAALTHFGAFAKLNADHKSDGV